MTGSVNGIRRKAVAKVADAEKAAEKIELAQAAKQSKKLAEQFKLQKEQAETGLQIFKNDLKNVSAVKVIADLKDFANEPMPAVLSQPESSSAAEALVATGSFGKALVSFAAKYKTQDDFEKLGIARKFVTEALDYNYISKILFLSRCRGGV